MKWSNDIFKTNIKSSICNPDSKVEINRIYENALHNNAIVVQCLEVLHNRWINAHDIDALIEANYMLDFYTSHMLVACDNNEIPIIDKTNQNFDILRKKRSLSWVCGLKSFDIYKRDLTYQQGLQMARDAISDLVDQTFMLIKSRLPIGTELPLIGSRQNKQIDFDTLLNKGLARNTIKNNSVAMILAIINNIMMTNTTYTASAAGYYRFINMHNNVDNNTTLLPLNCIGQSLTIIIILLKLGYPHHKTFVHLQKPSTYLKDKQTHWAVACEDISTQIKHNALLIHELTSLKDINISCSKAFALYTRDIISYLPYYIQNYDISHKSLRRLIFANLLSEFDKRFTVFSADIKTPMMK